MRSHGIEPEIFIQVIGILYIPILGDFLFQIFFNTHFYIQAKYTADIILPVDFLFIQKTTKI